MFIKNFNISSKNNDIFEIANKANKAKELDNNVINATIGSLLDENNKLVTYKCIYNNYRNLSNEQYAKYSSSFIGNPDYLTLMKNYIIEDKFYKLNSQIIATPGGTGAISLAVHNFTNANEMILIPSLGWSNYKTIAKNFNLNIIEYEMFDENNNFNLKDIKSKINYLLTVQNKVFVIINSPAHNPSGYSLKLKEWKDLVLFLNNECQNKEIILLNDIAYIDYCFNKNNKEYLKILDDLNKHILLLLASSTSKSFSYYGLRLGNLIIANKNKETTNIIFHELSNSARAIWSNVNNSAMENIKETLLKNKLNYLLEKDNYTKLLKMRSKVFIKGLKENKIEFYPYKEGFFITLKFKNDNLINIVHQELINNKIYTITTYKGIRIAICSLSVNECKELPNKIKEVLKKRLVNINH